MRLGKPMEHLQAAFRAAQIPGEAAQQITKIGRQLSYFGYLSYDTLIWVSAIDVHILQLIFFV
jgi:peroxin-11B